jgi:hypothetical protein
VRRALALASLLGGLCIAAPAAAQVVTLRGHPGPSLTQGPVLSGERLAWSQTTCLRGCDQDMVEPDTTYRYEIFTAEARGPARRLFHDRIVHASLGASLVAESYSFLLSEQLLATVSRKDRGDASEGERAEVEVIARAPGAPPVRLADCSVDYTGGTTHVALDGSRLAYEPNPCDDENRFVLHDLATGEVLALPDSAGGPELQVRGRYAAWLAPEGGGERLTVYDLVAGTVAYSAATTKVLDLDLDADGSLAVVSGHPQRPCRSGRLFRFSAAAPWPTEVSAPVCAGGVKIDAGRIVFLGWDGFTRTLRLASPDGSIQDLVRFGRVRPASFDFGSERLTWAARDCGGGEAVFTGTLGDAPHDAGSINCRARFGSGVVPVRRGIATVRLRCPRGCGGELSLRHMGRRDFSLLRGERDVRVRLWPPARARLARRGSLRALAKIVTHNRAGDRHARSRAVTLVAR